MGRLHFPRRFGVALWRFRSGSALTRAVEVSGTDGSRKLQIGSGGNSLPGWINTDCDPAPAPTYFLNATAAFPIRDAAVDYVFSEHMIEHISFAAGSRMLGECFRILKPGGKIRLATPDLRNILSLCFDDAAEHSSYKQWAVKFNDLPSDSPAECQIVNNFMRAWGHIFVYDEPTLRSSLARAGFAGVRRFPAGQSDDPQLAGLERHGKIIGEQFNEFETMVLQARKPAQGEPPRAQP